MINSLLKTTLFIVLLVFVNAIFAQSTIADITTRNNVNELFEKNGQRITFDDDKKTELVILTIKNSGSNQPRFRYRIGYYSYQFAFVTPGVELNVTHETAHHKFDLNAHYSSLYGDEQYMGVKGVYTYNYLLIDKLRKRQIGLTSSVIGPVPNSAYNKRMQKRAAQIEYAASVYKNIRFKMGNYVGIERNVQQSYQNYYGLTLHLGTNFSWLSDYRFIGEKDKSKIIKSGLEDNFYFEFQYYKSDNAKFTNYYNAGFIVGYLRKSLYNEYEIDKKEPRRGNIYVGYECGFIPGPEREVLNLSIIGLRVGAGF